MKLTQLQYFKTICEYNNITRAAGKLHVSQPSLSNAIKELEVEFGISLFYRLSKGLTLTKEGEVLLEEATRLLEQADLLVSRMNVIRRESQIVKLGVPPMLASLIFPKLLHSYRSSFPNARLQMIENGTLTNKTMVTDGTLDAAIISCDGFLPAAFHYTDLLLFRIYFYVSGQNPLASQTSVDMEETANLPLVLLAEDSFLTDYLMQYYKAHSLTPNVIIYTNQIATIRQLVENNTAMTFLFENILEPGENIARLAVRNLPAIQTKLIWNANKKISSATQNLIRLSKINYQQSSVPD